MRPIDKSHFESEVEKIKKLIETINVEGAKHGSSVKKGFVYHPIDFDEFTDINIHKSNSSKIEFVKLFEFMNERGIYPAALLDVGAHVGYFTFNFSRELPGCNIVAVERDEIQSSILRKLVDLYEIKNIELVNSKVTEYFKSDSKLFDVGLLLNVHMWIMKEEGYLLTNNILKTMRDRCRHIFFQTCHREAEGAYVLDFLHNTEDIKSYLKDLGFESIKLIHKSDSNGENSGRELFYLSRYHEIF